MKKVKVKINLYTVDELDDRAKFNAVEEHRTFLLSVVEDRGLSEESSFLDDLEDVYDDEYVLENIRANEYLFFKDGVLANSLTHYEDGVKKSILELHGESYPIPE